MTEDGSRHEQDSTPRDPLRSTASMWTFGTAAKEQHALAVLEGADPEFARRLTARLIPKPEELEPDVVRRVVR